MLAGWLVGLLMGPCLAEPGAGGLPAPWRHCEESLTSFLWWVAVFCSVSAMERKYAEKCKHIGQAGSNQAEAGRKKISHNGSRSQAGYHGIQSHQHGRLLPKQSQREVHESSGQEAKATRPGCL